VIAEACFLLSYDRQGETAVLERVAEGIIKIDFSLSAEIDWVQKLMRKYKNVPMSFADACLVRMSETIEASGVFTLDSDFRVYRRHKRQEIPVIIPE